MTKAFVDTTVLCDLLLPTSRAQSKTAAAAALRSYTETELPSYALREFRAGALGYLVLLYNVLVAHDTIEAALERFETLTARKPRQHVAGVKAIIRGMLCVRTADPNEWTESAIKKQLETWLCGEISQAWQQRRDNFDRVVQPLACFIEGELEIVDDQLVTTGGTLHCDSLARCSAAAALKGKSGEVDLVLKALRPAKGSFASTEIGSRRKALKEILRVRPDRFDKRRCRAIGDAYFCIMAPKDSAVLTTNIRDFKPMADVLGITVKAP